MLATDTGRSASASIVALQSGAEGAPGRIHVEHGSVTIYDTRRAGCWSSTRPAAAGNG